MHLTLARPLTQIPAEHVDVCCIVHSCFHKKEASSIKIKLTGANASALNPDCTHRKPSKHGRPTLLRSENFSDSGTLSLHRPGYPGADSGILRGTPQCRCSNPFAVAPRLTPCASAFCRWLPSSQLPASPGSRRRGARSIGSGLL